MKPKVRLIKVIFRKTTETSSNKFNSNFNKSLEIGTIFRKQVNIKTNSFSL